jgi:tetratricopeptide (TPR) repeat protein
MLWRYSQHLFHSYGALWFARGNSDATLAYADECLRGAEASNSPKNVVKARRLRGEAFLARGELPAAAAELDFALELARRIGNPPQLWRTLAAIAELRQVEQHPAKAQRAYRQALAVVGGVASRVLDTRLRETFLSSPHIQRILQLADAASPMPGRHRRSRAERDRGAVQQQPVSTLTVRRE